MKVFVIKTDKIKPGGQALFYILDKYLPSLKEGSIVAITSKIVSICEGRVVKIRKDEKEKLVEKEAEYFLPSQGNKYNVMLTIKGNVLAASAGIDESNGAGYHILLPKDPQETANDIRRYLRKKFSIKKLGVIITDSRTTPLRWGTTGVAISYSGFAPLYNYIGKRDIFGRKFEMQKTNIVDALATSAVLTMGEGAEQTPLALIEDVPFVKFQEKDPSKKELDNFHININDDLYGPLLKNTKWRRGKSRA
ncbi:MAG: coenzyme F420-0:L-glutamate ligase [Candidatus Paceibacterota bacterium]